MLNFCVFLINNRKIIDFTVSYVYKYQPGFPINIPERHAEDNFQWHIKHREYDE